MGLPVKARQALFEQLQRLSTLTKLEAPDQVISIIQDMMRATWFRIDAHDVLTLTSCGSRPGDPAADVLFALAFGEFLKVVDTDLSALGCSLSGQRMPLNIHGLTLDQTRLLARLPG